MAPPPGASFRVGVARLAGQEWVRADELRWHHGGWSHPIWAIARETPCGVRSHRAEADDRQVRFELRRSMRSDVAVSIRSRRADHDPAANLYGVTEDPSIDCEISS